MRFEHDPQDTFHGFIEYGFLGGAQIDAYKTATAGIDYKPAAKKNLTKYDVLIIASIVTTIELAMNAWFHELFLILGIFLGAALGFVKLCYTVFPPAKPRDKEDS